MKTTGSNLLKLFEETVVQSYPESEVTIYVDSAYIFYNKYGHIT